MKMRGTSLFAVVTSFCTFILLIAGAMVTSTGSGLAVPDWPLSFGQFFPEMVGGVFYEHGHRMIAGVVGILMTALFIMIWKTENRRWLCWLGTAGLGVVLLQALLGGLTVLYGLPRPISVTHAVLAQTFFCLTVSIALFMSPWWEEKGKWTDLQGDPLVSKRLFYLCAGMTFLIYVQLILGATLRHGGGRFFLLLHLSGALLAGVVVAAASTAIFKNYGEVRELRGMAVMMTVFLSVQILLGVIVLLPMMGIVVPSLIKMRTVLTTAHVAVGALLLASSLATTLWSFQGSRLKT